VLLEGDDLSESQVFDALKSRFPDEAEFRRQRPAVLFVFASGLQVRKWRFIGDSPRTVDGTVYL
jgi:hypothetical protein